MDGEEVAFFGSSGDWECLIPVLDMASRVTQTLYVVYTWMGMVST
jgi:hypothetical protein